MMKPLWLTKTLWNDDDTWLKLTAVDESERLIKNFSLISVGKVSMATAEPKVCVEPIPVVVFVTMLEHRTMLSEQSKRLAWVAR